MIPNDVARQYNYATFTRETVEPMLRFDDSPPVGDRAPDYPLWTLDGTPTSLGAVWAAHTFTVVEFGSFT